MSDVFPMTVWCASDTTGSSLGLVEIEYSDLEFKEEVGSGGFGTVSRGLWVSENMIVAIKTMLVLEEREVG